MDYSDGMNLISQVSQYNNAWSAEQAQKQMDFQERMSNTAHQREVADLRAAGLNPVLSAHGTGASTPDGAMAGTDTNLTSAMYGLVKQALDAQMISAKAVASVASSASGSGSGSVQNVIKKGLQSVFGSGNSAVNEAKSADKFEQDREAKKRDTKYQQASSFKFLGVPIGLIANEVAERQGYNSWPEMVVDDIQYLGNQNSKVGKSISSAITEAKKKVEQGFKKSNNKTSNKSSNSSGKKVSNIRHTSGKFNNRSIRNK